MTITFSLQWVLVAIAVTALVVGFWSMHWTRYKNGIDGAISWLAEVMWLLPVGVVLLIWAAVEWLR